MSNKFDYPNRLPLIILSVGTLLPAIPAVALTVTLVGLLYESQNSQKEKLLFAMMLGAAIAGFALLFGYFRAVVYSRYNAVFWLLSMLYNLMTSGLILYFLLSNAVSASAEMDQILKNVWGNPAYLFLLWTTFVTAASGYYYKFDCKNKSRDAPAAKSATNDDKPPISIN